MEGGLRGMVGSGEGWGDNLAFHPFRGTQSDLCDHRKTYPTLTTTKNVLRTFEINGTTLVDVDFVDHVTELLICWVLAERAHDVA
jgi:hypothetical protein